LDNFLELIKNWLTTNNVYIQAASPLIQAVCSILLFIITLKYVAATSKMVHLPHKTYVKPVSVNLNKGLTNWYFKVKNYGTGLAINIKVYTVVSKYFKFVKESMFLFESNIVFGKGPSELQANQEAIFEFDGLIDFNDPVIVSWESLAGKKYKKYWKITIGSEDKISSYGIKRKLSFLFKRIRLNLFSPFIRVYYWFITGDERKEIRELAREHEIDILSVLMIENHLFYDEIAEKLKIEEWRMKRILSFLGRNKRINFDGNFVNITESGVNYYKKHQDVVKKGLNSNLDNTQQKTLQNGD